MDETKDSPKPLAETMSYSVRAALAVISIIILFIISAQNPSHGVIVVCPNCSFSGEFVWGNPASPDWGSMGFTVVCVNCKHKIPFTVYENGTVVVH